MHGWSCMTAGQLCLLKSKLAARKDAVTLRLDAKWPARRGSVLLRLGLSFALKLPFPIRPPKNSMT